MSKLNGKIAIVTGANSGIGLATAKTFLAEGATRVYMTGRRKAELDEAVAALNALDRADAAHPLVGKDGPRAIGVQAT